jgi:hypothetical protein
MKESDVTKDVGNEQAKGPDIKDKKGKQSDLVDRRHGAYDDVGRSDDGVPEGLRREPKHPLNPHTGRGGVPSHVPGPKTEGPGLS